MKVILVDDEELSLKRLGDMLNEISGVEICGRFLTADEALQYIEKNKVDAVFLDICIPEVDGLTLASKIQGIDGSVDVVFVTGFDDYAVTAFELEATDYLMKPISKHRLEKTIERLQRSIVDHQKAQGLQINCFGGFQVSTSNDDSSFINWRSPKTEELFAYLIFKQRASRDEIVNTLWDGLDPDKASKNINTTVYYIRKTLSLYGLDKCIVTTHKEIRINTDLIHCDLYELEELLNNRLKNNEFAKIADRLIELYKGELFQSKAYEWSFTKSRSIENYVVSFLMNTANYHLDNQNDQTAERIYKRVLEIDPINEEACGSLMRICIKTGRKSEAQRLYFWLENLLINELGERPQEKLKKLLE